MSSILFFCVSFFASIAGAICGIGGGVIIKPVLDMLGLASVATDRKSTRLNSSHTDSSRMPSSA